MAISARSEGNTAIITVTGRLALGEEVDTFRSTWEKAVAGGAHDVVVNLIDCVMVDSSGIGSLIRCYSAVSSKGGQVKLAAANEMVRNTFRITKLDRVFVFFDSEEAALSRAAAAGA